MVNEEAKMKDKDCHRDMTCKDVTKTLCILQYVGRAGDSNQPGSKVEINVDKQQKVMT